MKVLKIIMWSFIALFLVIMFVYVFQPAYNSYAIVCKPNEIEGFVLVGMTILTEEGDIIVALPEDYRIEKDVKHEFIHVAQLRRGWFSPLCEHPIRKWLGECEAYAGEHYPDGIYELFYGTDYLEFL